MERFGFLVTDHRSVEIGSLVDSTKYPLVEKVTVGGFVYECMVEEVKNEPEPKLAKIEHFVNERHLVVDLNFGLMGVEPVNPMMTRSIYENGRMIGLIISLNGFLGNVPGHMIESPVSVALVYHSNLKNNFDMGVMISPDSKRVFLTPIENGEFKQTKSASLTDEGLMGLGIGTELVEEMEFWVQLKDSEVRLIVQEEDSWLMRSYPLFCDYSRLRGQVSYRDLSKLVSEMGVARSGGGYNWRHE